jgi:uncharacterized protein
MKSGITVKQREASPLPGVSKYAAEAAKLYRKAAGAGNVNAMQNLASLLRQGRGVAKSIAEAKKWEKKAKEAGGN